MFKFVHHVSYFVRSRDEFVSYMEKNFGMKPDKVEDREGDSKNALYRVGQTEIQVQEPVPGTPNASVLEKNGPGLDHVAWSVENVEQLAQELQAKGATLLPMPQRRRVGEHGVGRSYGGYHTINIDPKESPVGIHFQLVEGHQ